VSGFKITVTSSDGQVLTIANVAYPVFTLNQTEPAALPAASVTLTAADLTSIVSAGATNIELVTLTLQGTTAGSATISITNTALDNDSGLPINAPVVPSSVTITVS